MQRSTKHQIHVRSIKVTFFLLVILMHFNCQNLRQDSTVQKPVTDTCTLEDQVATNLDQAVKDASCITLLMIDLRDSSKFTKTDFSKFKNNINLIISNTVNLSWKSVITKVLEVGSIYRLDLEGTVQEGNLNLELNKPDSLEDLRITIPLNNIPCSITKFKNIARLELSIENLDSIPETVFNLNELSYIKINANNNKLRKLPDNIGGLVNLTNLVLPNSKIECLPKSILSLKKLEEIYIVGSPLANHEIAYFKRHKRYDKIQILIDSLPNCKIVLEKPIYPPRQLKDLKLLYK